MRRYYHRDWMDRPNTSDDGHMPEAGVGNARDGDVGSIGEDS